MAQLGTAAKPANPSASPHFEEIAMPKFRKKPVVITGRRIGAMKGSHRLPKCPLCGARCLKDIEDGSVFCSRWALDCVYGVFDADAHEAICAKLAEKTKPKGKVLARGWFCTVGNFGCYRVCKEATCSKQAAKCRRVEIVAAVQPRGRAKEG
jgi:hypothetical protein